MKAKLETLSDYEEIKEDLDTIKLLINIKKICYNFQDKKYAPSAIFKALDMFVNCKQTEDMSDQRFIDKYNDAVRLMKTSGIIMNVAELIIKQEHGDTSSKSFDENLQFQEEAQNMFLAFGHLRNMDPKRYSKIKEDLWNDFCKGQNNYPKTITESYELQTVYWRNKSNNKNNKSNNNNNNEGGLSFFNAKHKNKTCFTCGEKGHISPECPKNNNNTNNTNNSHNNNNSNSNNRGLSNAQQQNNKNNNNNSNNPVYNRSTGSQHFQVATTFSFFNKAKISDENNYNNMIKEFNYKNIMKAYEECKCAMSNNGDDQNVSNLKEWFLLDSQSTIDIFCNLSLLNNIETVKNGITLQTNAGEIYINKMGNLNGYGKVWCDERAITNILCLNNIKKLYRVTYDSASDDTFIFHKNNSLIKFTCSQNGLYFHDTDNGQIHLLNTVEENMAGFSEHQINRAKKARDLYAMVGYPTVKDFIAMIKNNMLMNCLVTVEDIKNAEKIFGPDIHVLKGKTVRQKPMPVTVDYVKIPAKILTLYHKVVLAIDIFFVNNLAFFISVARNLKFGTTEYITYRTKSVLLESIANLVGAYNKRSFKINTILADPEFEPLRDELRNRWNISLNCCSKGENVPEIECYI